MAVLNADTRFVPNRLITRALTMLATMVPQEITMVTMLANEMGSLNSV